MKDVFICAAVIVGGCALLVALAMSISASIDKEKACHAKGGVMIKASGGYECVKLERIPAAS